MFTCPVCFYSRLQDPPRDYNICECCGTEFGTDDDGRSWGELRAAWLAHGAPWFFGTAPFLWNPYSQLLRANVGVLPYSAVTTLVSGEVVHQSFDESDEIFAAVA
jgi:hypothetical protein